MYSLKILTDHREMYSSFNSRFSTCYQYYTIHKTSKNSSLGIKFNLELINNSPLND